MASKMTGKFTGVNPMGAKDWASITPSDTVDIPVQPDSIYVGVSGDIEVIGSVGTETFPNVPVGIFPISPTRVKAGGTTATNLIAMYYR